MIFRLVQPICVSIGVFAYFSCKPNFVKVFKSIFMKNNNQIIKHRVVNYCLLQNKIVFTFKVYKKYVLLKVSRHFHTFRSMRTQMYFFVISNINTSKMKYGLSSKTIACLISNFAFFRKCLK